jgi:8-oxo-dGTP pyrophosphatase MutT (NUDIX family)
MAVAGLSRPKSWDQAADRRPLPGGSTYRSLDPLKPPLDPLKPPLDPLKPPPPPPPSKGTKTPPPPGPLIELESALWTVDDLRKAFKKAFDDKFESAAKDATIGSAFLLPYNAGKGGKGGKGGAAQLLLGFERNYGRDVWSAIGGGVDGKGTLYEGAANALFRETAEELGVFLLPYDIQHMEAVHSYGQYTGDDSGKTLIAFLSARGFDALSFASRMRRPREKITKLSHLLEIQEIGWKNVDTILGLTPPPKYADKDAAALKKTPPPSDYRIVNDTDFQTALPNYTLKTPPKTVTRAEERLIAVKADKDPRSKLLAFNPAGLTLAAVPTLAEDLITPWSCNFWITSKVIKRWKDSKSELIDPKKIQWVENELLHDMIHSIAPTYHIMIDKITVLAEAWGDESMLKGRFPYRGVVFVLHIDHKHFTLSVLNARAKRVDHFDSLGSGESVATTRMDRLESYFSLKGWTFHYNKPVKTQLEAECGPFCFYYALAYHYNFGGCKDAGDGSVDMKTMGATPDNVKIVWEGVMTKAGSLIK